MKITLLVIGKTDKPFVNEGLEIFSKRLNRYLPYEMIGVRDLKNTANLSSKEQKQKESSLLQKSLKPEDHLILLDEKGKEFTSVEFASFVQGKMNMGIKNLVFAVGGPYGFSEEIKKKASEKISLSQMTFSHQLIRLIFAEQLYRAMTILKNEPYHNE